MTGGALSRAVEKVPGLPMIFVVHLKDQYANALVDASVAQMFNVGCEKCRWGSRCTNPNALTRRSCLALGRCVGGTVPDGVQNQRAHCENLGTCVTFWSSDEGRNIVNREDCEALGKCRKSSGMSRSLCAADLAGTSAF